MKDEPQPAQPARELGATSAALQQPGQALAQAAVAGPNAALMTTAGRKAATTIKSAALQPAVRPHPARSAPRSHVAKRKEPDAIEALLRAEPVATWQPASFPAAPVVVAIVAASPEPASLRLQAEPPVTPLPPSEPIVLSPVPEVIAAPPATIVAAAPEAAVAAADAQPAPRPAAMVAVEPQPAPIPAAPAADRITPAILPAFDFIAQILLTAPRMR